jgi:peptide/nickel transport system permease protein
MDKHKYFVHRLGQMFLTLLIIITILFLIFRLMPGNPMAAYITINFTMEQQQALMEQFGLDKPLWQQYFIYIGNLFRGNFGKSFYFREPVIEIILRVLPNTLYLMFSSLILAYLIGILGGIFLAWKRDSLTETVGTIITLFTRSAPQFWVGLIFLAVFSFKLEWFPSAGASPLVLFILRSYQNYFLYLFETYFFTYGNNDNLLAGITPIINAYEYVGYYGRSIC